MLRIIGGEADRTDRGRRPRPDREAGGQRPEPSTELLRERVYGTVDVMHGRYWSSSLELIFDKRIGEQTGRIRRVAQTSGDQANKS
jgi:hypothetical protein